MGIREIGKHTPGIDAQAPALLDRLLMGGLALLILCALAALLLKGAALVVWEEFHPRA